MTDQAIWNAGLGVGAATAATGIPEDWTPTPRHSRVPDSSQHPFRRYPCVKLFDRGGHSHPDAGTEILSKVKEPRA